MALTQVQKKLLIELDLSPGTFLTKIKNNKSLMNSFEKQFFQNGDGIYHLILHGATKKNEAIYLDIFKEFFHHSNIDVFQSKGKQGAAFANLPNGYGTFNGNESILNQILFEVLDGHTLANKEIKKNSLEEYWLKTIFRHLAKQESLIEKNINLVKQNDQKTTLGISFMGELTAAINECQFTNKAINLYLNNFSIEEIQKSFDKLAFKSIKYPPYRSNTYYVNPLYYNIHIGGYEKIKLLHENGINLDIKKNSYMSHEINGINIIQKNLEEKGELSEDMKDIIRIMSFKRKIELFQDIYLVQNDILRKRWPGDSLISGLDYMLVLDKEFTTSIVEDFFKEKNEQDNKKEDVVKILRSLFHNSKTISTLSLTEHILSKFHSTIKENIELLKAGKIEQSVENFFYTTSKKFQLEQFPPEATTIGSLENCIKKITVQLNDLGLLGGIKKNMISFGGDILQSRKLLEFFIEDIGCEVSTQTASGITVGLPIKILEYMKVKKINFSTKHSRYNHDDTVDALKYIFEKHNHQFLVGEASFDVINSVLKNNEQEGLSWFDLEFCKKIKNINKRVNLGIKTPEILDGKNHWHQFVDNLNTVGYTFSSSDLFNLINNVTDDVLLQKICNNHLVEFKKLLDDNYFWKFFPNDKEGFIKANLEKHNINIKEDILQFLLYDSSARGVNCIAFLKLAKMERHIDTSGDNLLHVAIKEKNYVLANFLIQEYPDLAEQHNRQKKIPIEYLFNYLNKNLDNSNILQSFKALLLSGVSKTPQTHKKIEALFEKYEWINNKHPEIKTMFYFKKMQGMLKTKECGVIENKMKI